MKICKKCQKEFDDNLTFCPFCNAENADKKLTYFERKQARDKDTQIILDKASIQNCDEEVAKEGSVASLDVLHVQNYKKAKLFSLIRLSASLLFAIACLVAAWIASSKDINANLKLAVILVAFLAIAVCASILISDIFAFLSLRKMSAEDFSLRKIYYSRGPLFRSKDDIYEIITNSECDECKSKMHLELKDDTLFLVCNVNRSHIYKIEKDAYVAYLKDKLSKKDNWVIISRGEKWNF